MEGQQSMFELASSESMAMEELIQHVFVFFVGQVLQESFSTLCLAKIKA